MSQMLTVIQETSIKIFTVYFLKEEKMLDNLPKFVRATNVLEKRKIYEKLKLRIKFITR